MTERSQPGVTRKVDNYTIGPSRLSFYRDKSQYGVMQIDINEVTVPIPRLLQGRITVQLGNLSDKHYRLDKEGHHHWWPVSPASAVEVQFEKPACSWHGHAYLDTNWGDRPLEEDIDYWCWSRFQNKQQTLIHYDVFYKGNDAYRLPACEPDKGLAIRVNNDGTSTTDTPPSLKKLKKTNWQMTRHARSESNLKLVSTLEDSPFYSRSLIETTIDNESLMGICESVSLQKFRKPIVQMMLPFRMPRRTGPTSQIYPPSRNETG